MEAAIGYEQLSGTQNETIIKELSFAGENVLETFQFLIPYAMRPHGDTEKIQIWTIGISPKSIVLGPE